MRKIFFLPFLFILFISLPVFAGLVPDTGQTKCYDNEIEIPCPQLGEPFYGQDANYTCNTHSYTDLDNGTIQDNVTGLMWQQATATGTYTWSNAITYCDNLTLGGYSDWRLPTIKELSTILDRSRHNPSIDTIYFPNTVASYYWSSTLHANNPGYAWGVDFDSGYMYSNFTTSQGKNVRAVRGEQLLDNNFIDYRDGTIIDTSSGLMWQKATAPGSFNWEQALTYCENLTLAGYSDWRLPNINELQSIVDYTRDSPTIDITYFPGTATKLYWSSTTYVDSTHNAWHVSFFNGYMSNSNKTSFYDLRAVRGGPCGSFFDADGDGILNDGDNSTVIGDNPCKSGQTANCDDNCIYMENPVQEDIDGDGIGNICDNCPDNYNPNQEDTDSDKIGDICDECPYDKCNDNDNDTICGDIDNCPDNYNPDQEDTDSDRIGDICEITSYSVPDAGQIKCYNNESEIICPLPGKPFYGQDASYACNPHSYTDLVNGIVRDNVTGLEWQQATAPGTYRWDEAIEYCDNLTLGGYSDWRLPTVKELSTLIDNSIPYPGPIINTDYFTGTNNERYWSSSTCAYNTDESWYVNFGYSDMGDTSKINTNFVRAVRGGISEPSLRFVDNNDATVTDTYTGLMWQKATAPGRFNWEQALIYCEVMSLAGYSDWRLPNINELQSIVDYTRYSPSADIAAFPELQGNIFPYYLSSTTTASDTALAFRVNFSIGDVSETYKYNDYYNVRAVRGGQCESFLDSDFDGIIDEYDNCPNVSNYTQIDCDNDNIGDVCDDDTVDLNGDGIDDNCLPCIIKWWGTSCGKSGNNCFEMEPQWTFTSERYRTQEAASEFFDYYDNYSFYGRWYDPCWEDSYYNSIGGVGCYLCWERGSKNVCLNGEWFIEEEYDFTGGYSGYSYDRQEGSWEVYCGPDSDSDGLKWKMGTVLFKYIFHCLNK